VLPLVQASLYVFVSVIWKHDAREMLWALRRVSDCLPEPPTPTSVAAVLRGDGRDDVATRATLSTIVQACRLKCW